MNRLPTLLLTALCVLPVAAQAQYSQTGYIRERAPAGAQAQQQPTYDADHYFGKTYLVPYVGYYDIGKDQSAAQFGLEYRMQPRFYGLRPTFGFNVTTDESLYGYAGVNWDINMQNSGFWFTPNFAVGAYEDGDGKDLGGTVEFRSGLEVSYDIRDGHRVGMAYNYISNLGVYDQSPGAQTLLVNYHLPFSW